METPAVARLAQDPAAWYSALQQRSLFGQVVIVALLVAVATNIATNLLDRTSQWIQVAVLVVAFALALLAFNTFTSPKGPIRLDQTLLILYDGSIQGIPTNNPLIDAFVKHRVSLAPFHGLDIQLAVALRLWKEAEPGISLPESNSLADRQLTAA